ncbi:putative Cytochrome 61 [Glarea lozoyensis 74030]|uniref:sterol 22-desaturase n=1 Tax=Glarea lozoyensis (strain ATCC 74030 / MF5533) TaxID=1104152 RepID=H0EQ19_GLAL7|nr:putative Cytochrome 61 [Glarea lozoyensis 74030]
MAGWSAWQYIVSFIIGAMVYDQVMYIKRKGPIAGPPFKIPFMGPFIQALHPKFDAYLAQWASGPLSCVSVFHKFVVLASDRDLAHKVFKSPAYAEPCIVPIAKDILGHKAWVFLQGKAHAEYRRGLTPLFTNKAMATYLPVHHKVLSDYFDKFVNASKAEQGKPREFMTLFREINCALSCRTFFGDYISQDAVKKIADDFYLATAALELVNVPLSLYVPFTKPCATTWLFQVLAQRPDVLDRLREENLAARGGDKNKGFDLPMLESLTYTQAVIKELLRHRPPVIFVPYLATKDFPVTPEYTVPKGSMIIPSCYPALHDPEVYPHPNTFDPERWITGDAESKTKNWLVFGAGPHDCLARRYVPLTMAGMIGKAALELDWKHHATERSEEIRVFATLFPMVCVPKLPAFVFSLTLN